MDHSERITQLCDELQVLAFNLADELDTLNFHSSREAVHDMRRNVYGMVDSMQGKILSLMHNLDHSGRTDEIDGVRRMGDLLNVVHNCSTEPESWRSFIDALIELIGALNKWGDEGPLGPGCGNPA